MKRFREILLCCAVLTISLIEAKGELPRGLTPCSRKSKDFDKCVVKEANHFLPIMVEGIKEIGLPTLNPLNIPKLEVTIPGLHIVMTNAAVHGLKESKVESCKMDVDGHTLETVLTLPLVKIIAHYSMDGEIAKIPLTGNGNGNINVSDLQLTYFMKLRINKHKNGLDYAEVDTSDIKHNTPRIQVHFDNLPLGEIGNQLINDNMDEIIKSMGPQVVEAFQEIVNKIVTTVLGHIPYDALTTD